MAARTVALGHERGRIVCERCLLADRPLRRLLGLAGRKALPAGEGILLTPSSAVHTWFMRFAIDVVFLDGDFTVLGVRENVKPWRAAGRRGARAVLELAAGEAAGRGIRPGDRLSLADGEAQRVKLLLFFGGNGDESVVVGGRGSVSAAARAVDAMEGLDLPVSVVVIADEGPTAA
jgi:uncharacterized membrane protein (UPF0127 family)